MFFYRIPVSTRSPTGSLIGRGITRMVRPTRWWLTSWTTRSVRIWRGLRRFVLTVVWDTTGVLEPEVSTPRPLDIRARLWACPRRSSFLLWINMADNSLSSVFYWLLTICPLADIMNCTPTLYPVLGTDSGAVYTCRVSSTLNRDTKQFGKKFLFDGRNETCWNSDQVKNNLLHLTIGILTGSNISFLQLSIQPGNFEYT